MEEVKVIIDSNVLVSILKGSRKLLPIYLAFRNKEFILVVTPQLLKELAAVLYRPRLKIDTKDIKELFRVIKENSLYLKPPKKPLGVCRDPEDNFILQAALEAKAKFIVTGDKDLLVLNPFKGISLTTPAKFISWLKR